MLAKKSVNLVDAQTFEMVPTVLSTEERKQGGAPFSAGDSVEVRCGRAKHCGVVLSCVGGTKPKDGVVVQRSHVGCSKKPSLSQLFLRPSRLCLTNERSPGFHRNFAPCHVTFATFCPLLSPHCALSLGFFRPCCVSLCELSSS